VTEYQGIEKYNKQEGKWIWADFLLHKAISYFSMVRISNSSKILIFGGLEIFTLLRETWMYDIDNPGWVRKADMSVPKGKRSIGKDNSRQTNVSSEDPCLQSSRHVAVGLLNTSRVLKTKEKAKANEKSKENKGKDTYHLKTCLKYRSYFWSLLLPAQQWDRVRICIWRKDRPNFDSNSRPCRKVI
jgi:hypothetical protein